MTKYIFITGGVVSGLGKGITAASLGRLLKMRGLKVAAQKLDPYMNVDPGTMSPFQHGEVFVTEDGAETDLDLGHYERFIDENLSKYSNLTSGKAYWNVLNKERQGTYLGKTVQIIPHITNEIKEFIYQGAKHSGADVMLTEVGGTTGDIESQPFLEAIRQVSIEVGRDNCLFIHVTLVPYLSGSNEFKSKPTQHSVKELQSMGITPNIIVTRSDEPIGENLLNKISMFCNVKPDCVIENITVRCLYAAVLEMHKKGLDKAVCRELGLNTKEPDTKSWEALIGKIDKINKSVKIAIVGKYVQLHDAYLSIMESLSHAGYEYGVKVDIEWVDSEFITKENISDKLKDCKGILVPGGFGDRGIEGKILAANYARVNNIPYFGICLGMQIAVIEYARNICGLKDAHSTEFNAMTANPVIDFLPDQKGNIPKGGTMRLGSYPCLIAEDTIMSKQYGEKLISERHRHRYEFNNNYRNTLISAGLEITGTSPDGRIVETVELPKHKYFIGVQFHPEFKSRPNKPHPLFLGFVKAALEECKTVRDYSKELENRVAFIKEIVKSSGASGIVYGNSGGKDSALVGILCKKACDNTLGVMMPCGVAGNYGADMSDGVKVADKYSIEKRVVDLSDTKIKLAETLGKATTISSAASNNINPRLRMIALYGIAASENRIVAGTGNRSEAYMGYFTKWGDGAYDFNPIADLTVTEIYEFLRYLDAPSNIITKAPSAGLFDGQTDEKEMGVTYAAIDEYLLNGKVSAKDIAIIDKFHTQSEHKRNLPNNYTGK